MILNAACFAFLVQPRRESSKCFDNGYTRYLFFKKYNQVSDQKAAQSFEYRRFVMLFGSSRVYRPKKIWVEKKLCVYEVCGHALLTIVGKSQILHG